MATVMLTIGRKILAEGRFDTKYRHLQRERKIDVDLSTCHWLVGVLIHRCHCFICILNTFLPTSISGGKGRSNGRPSSYVKPKEKGYLL